MFRGADLPAKRGRGSDRSWRSGQRRRRAQQPGSGPAKRRRGHVVMDEPHPRFIRLRRKHGDDARQNGDRIDGVMMVADGAKGAMVMVALKCGRVASVSAILCGGVTNLSRHGDRRPTVATREGDATVRRKNEGHGLQKEQTSDPARENPVCKTSRQGPNRRHTSTVGPLMPQVNIRACGEGQYSRTVAESTRLIMEPRLRTPPQNSTPMLRRRSYDVALGIHRRARLGVNADRCSFIAAGLRHLRFADFHRRSKRFEFQTIAAPLRQATDFLRQRMPAVDGDMGQRRDEKAGLRSASMAN